MHRLTSGVQDKVYAKIECRSLQPEDVFVLFPDFPASEAIAESLCTDVYRRSMDIPMMASVQYCTFLLLAAFLAEAFSQVHICHCRQCSTYYGH